MEKTPLINNLKGQNRVSHETALPLNVSPLAQNCMFYTGGVTLRPGIVAVSTNPLKSGNAVLGFLDMFVFASGTTYTYVIAYSDGSNLIYSKNNAGAFSTIRTISGAPSSTFIGYDNCWIDSQAVLVGDSKLYRMYDASTIYDLCPDAFDETGITATPGGVGAFNGVRNYKFAWRSSVDGTESPLSGVVVSGNAVNNNGYTIASLPTSAPSNSGVDTIRIYATVTGGSTYYFLADKTINGISSYADTTSDATLQTQGVMDEYRGKAPTDARCCCVWDDRLWIGYDNEILYSERTTGDLSIDGMAVWSRFYEENYLSVRELIADKITRLVPITNNQMLVFRETSIDVVYGAGPGTYVVEKICTAMGCKNPKSIAASANGVYFFSNKDIWFLANGSRTPQGLASPVGMNIFSDADQGGNAILAVGCYDATQKRYVVSFKTGNNASTLLGVSLAYEELSNTISYWNVAFDTVVSVSAHERRGIFIPYVGWRGRICYLSDSQGYDVATDSGTVTSYTTSPGFTITESGTTFSSSLEMCSVAIVYSDRSVAYFYITGVSGDTLTLNSSPAANGDPTGCTFHIGAIDFQYTTPPFMLSGDAGSDSILKRVWIVGDFLESSANDRYPILTIGNGNRVSGTRRFKIESVNDDSVYEPIGYMPDARGRNLSLSIRYPHNRTDNLISMTGWQVGYIRGTSQRGG